MRFWFSGPRILGIRTGVSFGPGDWQRAQSAPQQGSVYVIAGDHGLVKIGISTNVPARLATLQTSSPFPLRLVYSIPCADALMAEQEAHAALAAYRMAGEWFDVPAHIAIAAVQDAAGTLIEHDGDSERAIWKSLFWRDMVVMTVVILLIIQHKPVASWFAMMVGLLLVCASMYRRIQTWPRSLMTALKCIIIMPALFVLTFPLAFPLAYIASKIIAVLPIPWHPN